WNLTPRISVWSARKICLDLIVKEPLKPRFT
ncbi:MAG: hypothetical protein ACI9PZ_001533, partial [Parvicella sp.]